MSIAPKDPGHWFAGLHEFIRENPSYSTLHALFPQGPNDFRDWLAALRIHAGVQIKALTAPDTEIRDMVIDAIAAYQLISLGLPSCRSKADAVDMDAVAEIRESGYVHLPSVSDGLVNDILQFLEGRDLVPGDDPRDDARITPAEAKASRNVAHYPAETVLACPQVMNLANDPGVLAIVERYLGATPTLVFPAIWWSFADRGGPKDAQLFHIDYDDYKFCKLFIYLTDVDEAAGPHVFVETSHRKDVIDRFRRHGPLDPEAFDAWYYSQMRKSDDEVDEICHGLQRSFVGPAGSQFLVDTSGIHKGELPATRDRLLWQFTYGVTPQNLLAYAPSSAPDDGSRLAPGLLTTEPFAYVNRLFLYPASG